MIFHQADFSISTPQPAPDAVERVLKKTGFKSHYNTFKHPSGLTIHIPEKNNNYCSAMTINNSLHFPEGIDIFCSICQKIEPHLKLESLIVIPDTEYERDKTAAQKQTPAWISSLSRYHFKKDGNTFKVKGKHIRITCFQYWSYWIFTLCHANSRDIFRRGNGIPVPIKQVRQCLIWLCKLENKLIGRKKW